jgi:hypothetical protein
MLDKILIIYKGDKLMAAYYLGFATFLIFSAIFLYIFTIKIGWLRLSIGLFIFGLLCLGKGIMIWIVSKDRYNFYKSKKELSLPIVKEEHDYNFYRLQKKALNRRRYIYTLIVCFFLLIGGFLIGEKVLAIGLLVPIMLYSSTEFCVILLTEFRLWEYQRLIEKTIADNY